MKWNIVMYALCMRLSYRAKLREFNIDNLVAALSIVPDHQAWKIPSN